MSRPFPWRLPMRRFSVVLALFVPLALLGPGPAGALPTVGWTQQQPSTSPSARAYAWTAYDAAHGYVLLFGGFDATTYLNDTWAWNGTTWRLLHPSVAPGARDSSGIAYDSTHHRLILFGGFDGTTYLNDTWGWDGSNWRRLSPPTSPTPRALLGSLTDDPGIGGLLLYGGYDATGELSDTWAWAWT